MATWISNFSVKDKDLTNYPANYNEIAPKNRIIYDEYFIVNEYIKIKSSNLIMIELVEDLLSPFEILHGIFILTWSEMTNSLQFVQPNKLEITLQYEGLIDEELNRRKYNLQIYQYKRLSHPNGYNYNLQGGTYMQETSHSSYEFWGVPDYQYKLMRTPERQYSYSNKTYYEILEDIQKEKLDIEFKKESDEFRTYTSKNLNTVQPNHPIIFPSTVPTLSVIQNMLNDTWYPKDITSHQIPLFYINNKKMYYKYQFDDTYPVTDVYIGDKWYNLTDPTNIIIDDAFKDMRGDKIFVFNEFSYLDQQKISYFGSATRRNIQNIHEQIDNQKIPLPPKPTYWLNSQPIENEMQEIYKLHKEKQYWEFDQLYLDDEYSLENRMGKKYNLQLMSYFYNMPIIGVYSYQFAVNNLFKQLLLQDIVNLHINDRQFVIHYGEDYKDVGQIVTQRTLTFVPTINSIITAVSFGIFGKFTNFKQDQEKMKEMEHMWKYKYKHQYSDNKNYTGVNND